MERDQLWDDDFAVYAPIGPAGAHSDVIDIPDRMPGNRAVTRHLGL